MIDLPPRELGRQPKSVAAIARPPDQPVTVTGLQAREAKHRVERHYAAALKKWVAHQE